MWLKQAAEERLEATGLSHSASDLHVNYSEGVVGRYDAVQTFKADHLTNNTTSYAVTAKLSAPKHR